VNTPDIANPTSTESSIKPLLKLMISLVLAFVGFSFAFFPVLSIGFFRIMTIKASDNTLPDGMTFVDMLVMAVVLSFLYGIFVLIPLCVPFFIIGIPAALIGWKFKIIRWWVCLLGGGLITTTPVAFILTPITLGFFLRGGSVFSGDMFDIATMFLGSSFCGVASGLSFWLTLRFLHFSDISGPITYPIRFSR